jgi:cation diffusion facilitator CzcD-associated flavoprotein CzcO
MNSTHQRFDCEVAVIGAGPYGLGAAAHLKAAHVDTRVFGEPMSFWREHMPKGMNIRSAWHATHISDPNHRFTLDRYAEVRGFVRPDLLSLEDFVAYGEWFQAQAVPDVDTRKVRRVQLENDGFRLVLEDGNSVTAGRVVVATGLANQEFKPAAFRNMPARLASHSADHADLGKFRGQRVAVVGRGQSACESAAILSEAGAHVDLIARGEINWLGSDKTASDRDDHPYWRLHQLLAAPSGVGPFPVNWLNEFPGLERLLPQSIRTSLNRLSLRAGATGWLKPRFERVRVRSHAAIIAAQASDHDVKIAFTSGGGGAYDHVLLATGYHIDIARLGFFGSDLLGAVRRRDGSPRLGRGFESSVPGLHFLGANAVTSYGPVMRFIAGSPFAARELTRTILARRTSAQVRTSRRTDARLAKTTEAVSR